MGFNSGFKGLNSNKCWVTAGYTTQITSASSPVRLKLRTVTRNKFGSSVWKVVLVAVTEPRILSWRLDFWKICAVP